MEKLEVLDELFRRIARGAYASLWEIFTDDMTLAAPYSVIGESKVTGGKRVSEFLDKAYSLRFAALKFELVEIYPAREPGLYFVEYTSEARMRSNDAPYENRYIAIFRIREGKIAFWKEFYDPSRIAKALEQPYPELAKYFK
jgi:ketosteroid isomerase-like protein